MLGMYSPIDEKSSQISRVSIKVAGGKDAFRKQGQFFFKRRIFV